MARYSKRAFIGVLIELMILGILIFYFFGNIKFYEFVIFKKLHFFVIFKFYEIVIFKKLHFFVIFKF